ncbi:hypothetical protein [Pantoea sp. Acro-807]|uniref:hypothetical protein n=1 Tax=Pantoea sp. Acro-807 TaxID=2608356 RepID=UPI00141A20BC|nr:hypothetical protein [Pantoea sp. Acro-807]NIE72687.1 hypothetical protein [Pantoea sp. Acro-807]
MAYKLYFQYANGSRSHMLSTGSRRDAQQHLDYLLSEAEPRSLAQQIIIMYGSEIIMEVSPTLGDDEIRALPRWRKAGNTQQMHNPVTASIYMPSAARDFLLLAGEGNLAAGMRKIMLETGRPEIAAAYMADTAGNSETTAQPVN